MVFLCENAYVPQAGCFSIFARPFFNRVYNLIQKWDKLELAGDTICTRKQKQQTY